VERISDAEHQDSTAKPLSLVAPHLKKKIEVVWLARELAADGAQERNEFWCNLRIVFHVSLRALDKFLSI
jgi:hypothetical protein